jgi:hypothetical protein
MARRMSKQGARTIETKSVAVVLRALAILIIVGALLRAVAVGLSRLDYDALQRFMWSTF